MEDELVAGRSCGDCVACCVALQVDIPELQKSSGVACPHCILGRGCGIYETRYSLCREFHCGYRRFDWIDATLRPNLSGVLVFPGTSVPPGYDQPFSVKFLIMIPSALEQPAVIEGMCATIERGFATYNSFILAPGVGDLLLLNPIIAGLDRSEWSARLKRELRKASQAFQMISAFNGNRFDPSAALSASVSNSP